MKTYKTVSILAIFTLSIILRLWNFTQIGRTNDEVGVYVYQGYQMVSLARKGDFTSPLWWKNPDEPPLGRYLYGLAGQFDVIGTDKKGEAIFSYDLFYSRFVSLLFSSLTVLLVMLFGWEYLTPVVGILAGLILMTIPLFLGFSQLATLESLVSFFFTLCVYLYIKLLQRYSLKKVFLLGIVFGLSVSIKPTNILIYILFFLTFFLFYFFQRSKRNMSFFKKEFLVLFFVIPCIGCFTFFAIWPMILFHVNYLLSFSESLRFSTSLSIPELFFGKLHLVPVWYYLLMFLIETPFLLVLLFFIGVRKTLKERNWILVTILFWFLVPFLQSFYHLRQHGVRYIIEMYVPFSLLAAVGFMALAKIITKSEKRVLILFIPVFCYLVVILSRITPYYIDYFNVLVQGAKGVYQHRLFQLGWWGEGTKEAVAYVDANALRNETNVGILHWQILLVPPTKKIHVTSFREDKTYEYVIVNYYDIVREGFNEASIKRNYSLMHTVKADGADLVYIYKRK